MKYDIRVTNFSGSEVNILLCSKEQKIEYQTSIKSNEEKIIPYEEKGFVGFSEMELFVNEIIVKKIDVYGGNIINISENESGIQTEINFPDF